MAYDGSINSGNNDSWTGQGHDYVSDVPSGKGRAMTSGGKGLFQKKNPGSPGKLSRAASTKSESLAKLRGKGALA